MDEKKLVKIEADIAAAKRRLGNLKHNDLAKIAKMLGRERSTKRTNEPTYESALLDTHPITIPDHARGVNKWTAKSILEQFDGDVLKFKFILQKQNLESEIIVSDDEYEN